MKSLLIALALCTASCSAFGAVLSFTLTPASLSGAPGPDPLTFMGMLEDKDAAASPELFLNDIGVTFDSPGGLYLSIDPSYFPAVVPGSLLIDLFPSDATYTGPIFQVYIAPGTPEGVYTGTISILGGNNDNTEVNVVGTPQTFQVTVTPEPATAGLTLLALAGALTAARRRRLP